jgi:hypothetical protein
VKGRLAAGALAAATLALAGCSDTAATATPAPPASPYIVVISEPSQNIRNDDTSYLIAYWSCAPDADPRAAWNYIEPGTMALDEFQAAHSKWTEVAGEKRRDSLRVDVPCKPGDTITVALDAAAVAYRPTRLRCEIFSPDGEPLAREEATRPDPAPVCRTIAR